MSSTDTAMSHVNAAQQKEEADGSWLSQMYNGTGNFPFVAKRRLSYQILIAIFVLCIATIGFRGFNLGIDFEGGTRISMPPTANVQQDDVERVFTEATGVAPNAVQTVGSGDSQVIEINSERLTEEQIRQARTALFEEFKPVNSQGQPSEDAVNDSTVSESWGSSITQRMLLALGVFVLAVFAYIGLRMERDMAISAIIGVLIDLTIVSGLYALLGLDVSPATVIGLLTILAYSLYDTVVVFDKVQENTAGLLDSNRATYGEQVNLAINQTVMRSINTSIFSLVPIAALLVIAVWLMGVGTLKDLAVVQFIGVICGTFNSIFFAAPMLVSLKMRQQKYREHDEKVMKARERVAAGEEPVDDSEEAPRAGTRTVVSPNAGLRGQREQQPDATGPDTSGVSWRPGM